MTLRERYKVLNRILSKKLVLSFGHQEMTHVVVYQDPSAEIQAIADYYYEEAFNLNEGDLFTIDESFEILREKGDWSDDHETKLESLSELIDTLEKELKTVQYQKNRQKVITNAIKRAKEQQKELTNLKYSLLEHTLESFCNRIKQRYIVQNSIKFLDGQQDLLKNIDIIDKLSVLISREDSKIDEKVIRELARTSPFRIMWRATQEAGNSLFPHSTSEMSELQYALVQWSMMYDYAFNHPDRPGDDIIEDDEKFDAWYKNVDSNKNKKSPNVKGPKRNGGIQEVYIPADAEGAKEVYALNNAEAKQIIQKRKNYLKTKGNAKEQDLPDIKQHLKTQATQQLMKGRTK